MDIDFVIPWVNGEDEEWLKEKRKYEPNIETDASYANRYKDWNILKYWFRSIEKFTPWVHKIHFITWGHLPYFLNIKHPKLNIVNHKDYIPNAYLPTFNANTIEMNFHRISELSEQFVYFNDDMFVLKPLSKTDFFNQDNGLPLAQYTEIPIIITSNEVWSYLVYNDMYIINKYFKKRESLNHSFFKYINMKYHIYDNIRSILLYILFPNSFLCFKNFHQATPFLKSTYELIWEKEEYLLNNTCLHKFRNKEDVNQWLPLWWQLASGKFSPSSKKTIYNVITENTIEIMKNAIVKQKYDLLCLGDPIDSNNAEMYMNQIREAFEKILPQKSSFEI